MGADLLVDRELAGIEQYNTLRGPCKGLRRWWATRKTGFVVGLLVMSLISLAVAVGWGRYNAPYSPLYGYSGKSGTGWDLLLPSQPVATSTTGIAYYPYMTVTDGSESVTARGQKCSHAPVPVQTKVDKKWVELIPPGHLYEAPVPDVATRPPGGCFDQSIVTQIPHDMFDHLREEAHLGIMDTTWKIESEETPVDPAGTPVTWQSVVMVIHYQGPT